MKKYNTKYDTNTKYNRDTNYDVLLEAPGILNVAKKLKPNTTTFLKNDAKLQDQACRKYSTIISKTFL